MFQHTTPPGNIVYLSQMTGLDPERETILSISCFITDAQLNNLDADGWEATIHHEKLALDKMNDWCISTHGKSGLTAAAIASTTTPHEAAEGLLEYIKLLVPEKGKALLAGNSVHCDKEFLKKQPYNMVLDHLHYRILDVSSIKEAVRRWAPERILNLVPKKKGLHQAREDILESIEEARFYRDMIFQSADAFKGA